MLLLALDEPVCTELDPLELLEPLVLLEPLDDDEPAVELPVVELLLVEVLLVALVAWVVAVWAANPHMPTKAPTAAALRPARSAFRQRAGPLVASFPAANAVRAGAATRRPAVASVTSPAGRATQLRT